MSEPDLAAPALAVTDLAVRYGDAEVLHGVCLTAQPGQIVGVAGANGAGKSTLLRALSGNLKPRSGKVLLFGEDLTGKPTHAVASRGMVHVPEGRGIFSSLSVADNLLAGAIGKNRLGLDEILEIFPHLQPRLKQIAGNLSGGEQQMVAIGRGLISHPRVVLIDELSLGLAPMLTVDLYDKLVAYASANDCTMVLVDQNLDLLRQYCDRITILRAGAVWLEQGASDFGDDRQAVEAYLS